MTKNKNNQTIWNTRIKNNASSIFQRVGSSIGIDKRLYKEDITGSIAHVEMLFKQKIISFKVKNKIVFGLNKIEKEISKKDFFKLLVKKQGISIQVDRETIKSLQT